MLSDNVGEEFLDDEIRVLVIHCIVFERAIFSYLVAGFRRGNDAGVDEKSHCHWKFTTMDQVVEHDRHAGMTVLAQEPTPVLKHHQVGWLRSVVLCRDVDPVIAFCAWEVFAVRPLGLDNPALGDVGLALSQGAGAIIRRLAK